MCFGALRISLLVFLSYYNLWAGRDHKPQVQDGTLNGINASVLIW